VDEIFPGVGIGGYRSFPEGVEFITPMDRLNVVIGPNNSGKSTLLTLFHYHLQSIWDSISHGHPVTIDPSYARRVRGETPPLRVAWPLRVT
jgi:AAA15 family ATPase/GTPase